jgi:hypothetical protein
LTIQATRVAEMQGGKGRRERLARIAALAEQVWEDDDLAHRFL